MVPAIVEMEQVYLVLDAMFSAKNLSFPLEVEWLK